MATLKTLDDIKNLIEKNIGKRILIKTDKGRNKIKENEGVLLSAYSSLFIVQVKGNRNRKISFSYSDVLTEKVIIKTLYNDKYIAI